MVGEESAYLPVESAYLPVAPEVFDSSPVKSRRNSIAKASTGNTDVVVPHYRRASIGSCHDFCKYGWKHAFEVKEKHSLISKVQRTPLSQSSEGDVNGEKTYVANRRASIGSKPPMKASMVKLGELVNSVPQISNTFDTNEKEMPTKLSDSPKQGRSEVPVTKKKTSVVKLKTIIHRKSHSAGFPKIIRQGYSSISAKLAGTSSKLTLGPVRDSSKSTAEPVETSKSIAEQQVESSLKSTNEPVETLSESIKDPVGIPSIAMVEPVECSSKSTPEPVEASSKVNVEPVETSSILTVEPIVTSTESIMDPVEIPSISIVEPVECSSKSTPELVETTSIFTVEPMVTSSESIMVPVGSSSKSCEEYAEAASKPTVEPVEALSKSIAKKDDVSSKSIVKRAGALSRSTPKKLEASLKSPAKKVEASPRSTAKKVEASTRSTAKKVEASSKSTAQKVETLSKLSMKKLEATSKSTDKKKITAKEETSPKSADKKEEMSMKSTAKKLITPTKSTAKVATSSKSTAEVGMLSKSVVKKVVTPPKSTVKNVEASSTSNSMVRTSSKPTLKVKQMKLSEKHVAPLKSNPMTVNSVSSMNSSEGSNGQSKSKLKMEKGSPSLKVAARKSLTPSRASLPSKSSLNNNGVVSINARKHKNLKIASQLKNQLKTRKYEYKEPGNDAVEEKTLYVIKMESGNKSLQTDVEFSPQSSSPPKFLASSQEGKEESECTTSEGKEDCFSLNLEGELMKNGEASEVKDIGEARTVGIVSSEDKASQMSTLNFRRGKLVELQSEITSPRRLKFRRATTGFEENALVRSESLRRSFKRRYENVIVRGTSPGPEKVVLRRQGTYGKRDGHGLFNNVIEETANKLAEIRKSKVKALVGAFESIISLQERKPAIKTVRSL